MRLHSRDILTKGLFANVQQRNEATAYVAESIRRYEVLINMRRSQTGSPEFVTLRDRLLMQLAFASHVGHDPTFVKQIGEAARGGDLRIAAQPLTVLQVHITQNPESSWPLSLPGTGRSTSDSAVPGGDPQRSPHPGPLQIRATDRTAKTDEPPTWCSVRLVENLLSTSLEAVSKPS